MRIDKTIFVLLQLINYSFSVMNEVRRNDSGETLKELVAFRKEKKYYKVLHHLSDDSFDLRICCVFILYIYRTEENISSFLLVMFMTCTEKN